MNDINSFYPVICTNEGREVVSFFIENFGFEMVFKSEWYWHLTMVGPPDVNVAFVQADHPSVPLAYQKPVQGLILNIELPDIDKFYRENQQQDWDVVLPLRSEPWGQRHFIVATPIAGLLVDLIQVIPPTEEFKNSYQGDAIPVS